MLCEYRAWVRSLMPLRFAKTRAFVRLWRASYFLFAWPKRKLTKEKGHPAWRLPGSPARQVREPRPGFSTGLLSGRKGVDIRVDSRFAACRPRLTAAQGPRVKQRAILARTRCKSSRAQKRKQLVGWVELAKPNVVRSPMLGIASLSPTYAALRLHACRYSLWQ
jgi:hypothetical protein